MFVKPDTSSKKLLDKKPLRTASFGESKGFRDFKKFIMNGSGRISLLLKDDFIGVDQPQLCLSDFLNVLFGGYVFLVFFQILFAGLLRLQLGLQLLLPAPVFLVLLIEGHHLDRHHACHNHQQQCDAHHAGLILPCPPPHPGSLRA